MTTKTISSIDCAKLKGETIKSINFGHPGKPDHNNYGVVTLKMKSGKKFVISCSMLHSELSFWEDLSELHELVEKALKCGWVLAKDTPQIYYLKLPGDKSEYWARKNQKLLFDGRTIAVPHYLERRMKELNQI